MKKLVIYILLFTTLSGVLAPLTYVHAADTDANGNPIGTCQVPPPTGGVRNNITKDDCDGVAGTWTPNSANTPAQVNGGQDQTDSTGACSKSITNIIFGSFDLIKCAYQVLSNFVYDLILSPFAIFLGLAGSGLDMVITYTILNMADKISGPNAFTGINIAWKLIRDLMNIFFIFILVYEAILLILGMSSTENIGKFIGYLVLAALLVNFSLFFTKILIDASNIVTIGIYNNILQSAQTVTIYGRPIGGISVPFMASLGLGKLFANESVSNMFDGPLNAIIGMIMGALFMFIAGIIFIVISIMFIIRYVTLLLLLMLSPIGFMGSALSFMKDPAKKWWTALNSQLIFPPVYMLLTWVVLTLMQSKGFITASNAWDKQSYIDNKIGFVMNFIVIIILLIATLIISKDVATKGSSYIKNATGKLSAFAGGAIVGGGAALARNTIGRRYDRLAQDQQLKDRAAQGDKGAQARLATYRSIASTNFDARGAFKAAGVDLGKATNKGGYRGAVEAKADKEKKYAESLKLTDYEKARGRAALAEHDQSEKAKLIEEQAKVEKFDNNATIQEEYAKKRKPHEDNIRNEEKKIKDTEEEITKEVKGEVDELQGNVSETERKIQELQLKLDNIDINSDPNVTGAMRVELESAKQKKQGLDAQLKDKKDKMDSTISNRVEKETRENQRKIKSARDELADIQEKYNEQRNKVISDTRTELIARAGNPDKIKDHLGNEISSHDATRISQYADYQAGTEQAVNRLQDSLAASSETKARYNPARYYQRVQSAVQANRMAAGRTSAKNHEVAAKIRGLNTKKTTKQLLDEALAASGEVQTADAAKTASDAVNAAAAATTATSATAATATQNDAGGGAPPVV